MQLSDEKRPCLGNFTIPTRAIPTQYPNQEREAEEKRRRLNDERAAQGLPPVDPGGGIYSSHFPSPREDSLTKT